MATKKMAVKKPATRRTTPRVSDTESTSKGDTQEEQLTPPQGTATPLANGDVMISAQLSEKVPVAQYANVTLGPVQISFKVGNIDMEKLIGVEWPEDLDAEIELTEEQAEVFDRVTSAVKAGMRVLEHPLSTDRVAVERSVQAHNQRAEEQEAAKDKKTAKKSAPKPKLGRSK